MSCSFCILREGLSPHRCRGKSPRVPAAGWKAAGSVDGSILYSTPQRHGSWIPSLTGVLTAHQCVTERPLTCIPHTLSPTLTQPDILTTNWVTSIYTIIFFFFFCHYHYIPISHYMGWGDMLKYVPGGRDIREIPCFLDRGWWRIAQSSLLGRYAWSNPELNAEYLIQIWGWR